MPRPSKGYAKPGRPKGSGLGYRVAPATRERIRGAMLVKRLEDIAEGKITAEPHQVTAALGLLRFQLPTLAAQDITSGGAPITIEQVRFQENPK